MPVSESVTLSILGFHASFGGCKCLLNLPLWGGGAKAQNCDRLFHKRASRNKKVYFPSSTKIPFPWRFRDSSWDGNGRLNDFGSKVEQKGFLGGKVRWPNYYEKNSLG